MDNKELTVFAPRVTFKRTSIRNKVGWEISSSSSKDKEELLKIIDMIKEVSQEMENKFISKKTEVEIEE